jgi:O-antigen/teichoic acid export membrane protein
LFNSLLNNKYVKNTGWLFAERVTRFLINIFVTVYLVKYLGPARFGLYNYILSYVSIFGGIAALGIDSVIVRDLINDFTKTKELLGTSFFLRIGASFLMVILMILSLIITKEETYTIILISIVSFSIFLQSFGVIDFYFQAIVRSKYSVLAQSISVMTSALLKIILIIVKADLLYFAIVVSFEALILAIGFIINYKRINAGGLNWKFDIKLAKKILYDSYPLLLSGIVIAIYMKIDQVMIKRMLNNTEAGYYASAVKLCEMWYFIPMAISSSLYPAIINAKKKGEIFYKKRLQQLYDIMSWLSIGIALFFTIFAHSIIIFLYGSKFIPAVPVLQLYVWSSIGTFLGVASSQFLVTENLTKISFYRTFIGMVLNVVLNFYLIPRVGISGAAFATLISYTVSTFGLVFFKSSYMQIVPMLRSLLFISIFDYKDKLK